MVPFLQQKLFFKNLKSLSVFDFIFQLNKVTSIG